MKGETHARLRARECAGRRNQNAVSKGSSQRAQFHSEDEDSARRHEQPSAKDISNKYASLKAVAEKASDNYYSNRRQMVDFALKGSLPLQPASLDSGAPYSAEMVCPKQNGHRAKSGGRSHAAHALAYASNTISSPGLGVARGWGASETLGRRQSYGAKRHYGLEQHNLRTAQSQHFTTQPYFITNSKTEVTV
ncbi:hypothetical protein AAFF_G00212610 [Aldrovandia affinis]|uniref:Uncharacterized protein n=1 Tax=Aldrovandia affinis TaxID=143900 RepID=A0AAD7RH70_9TELE|nr:hypothetical protein AAFF_G00212610 [Aldrovandia affinis]